MRFSELKQYRNDILAQGDRSAEAHRRLQDSPEAAHYIVDRGITEYRKELPCIPVQMLPESFVEGTRHEVNVIDLIEAQLRHKLESGHQEKLSILDLGCGRGDFLVELYDHLAKKFFEGNAERLCEHVALVGLTIADLRNSHFKHVDEQDTLPPNEVRLRERGIEYLLGDMRALSAVLATGSQSKFDCIVSNIAIRYVQPVRMRKEVLRQLYRALKPDGIAAMTGANWLEPRTEYDFLSSNPESDEIETWVNETFRLHGLAIQSTDHGSRLVMHKNNRPFRIDIPYKSDGELPTLFFWASAIKGKEWPILNDEQTDQFRAAYANALDNLLTAFNIHNAYTELVRENVRPGLKAHLPSVFRSFVATKLRQDLERHLKREDRSDALDERLLVDTIYRFFVFQD